VSFVASLRLGLTLILLFTLAACSSTPTAVTCLRYEGGYLGPGNHFELTVANDKMPMLDAFPDRITLSLSLLPPSAGETTNATLVHMIGDNEAARWNLRLPPPDGISTRCTIGATRNSSNCGATLGDLPSPAAGKYFLRSDGGKLIEAGLSFFVCE